MKKIIILLFTLFILVGCNTSKQDESLKIVVPSGAPSLAFYNELDNPDFYTGDASSIMPEFSSNNSDILVIDTINGIKAINKTDNYLLAATITFGNFYIASTGNDEDKTMNDGDYIVLFSSGATPDLVFHYLYGDSLDSNIHYVNAVKDAGTCLIKGINILDDDKPSVDYVMIAEPLLSVCLSQNEKASVYQDVQELYKQKTNSKLMIQAGVFVSKDLDSKTVDEYLNSLQKTINGLLDEPNKFNEETSNLSDDEIKDVFGIPNSMIATRVLKSNSIGLGYKKAYDIKEDIDEFISIFNMDKTSEEIYYK